MRTPLSRARRAGLFAPVALAAAAAGILLGGPSGPVAGEAADRFRAGEPATRREPLPAAAEAPVRARGLAHARALGIPPGTGSEAARIVDRFAGATYDEVVTVDSGGRRLGVLQMDGHGALVSAVRLGWQPVLGSRRQIDANGAVTAASRLAAAAGLPATGAPTVASGADDGWTVTWPRVVDGVPALGDGVRVTLFADGSFHAAASRTRELATASPDRITRAEAAESAARKLVAVLGAGDAVNARIVDLRLGWVAANGAFDPAAPDAPDAVLRLAWVAEARTSGPLADTIVALELYLDAGDGRLIGGDVLR